VIGEPVAALKASTVVFNWADWSCESMVKSEGPNGKTTSLTLIKYAPPWQ
jgi:hypothetical protein